MDGLTRRATKKGCMYTIEYLIQKFTTHDIEWNKQHQGLIDDFKQNNPDVPLTSYLKDDFSLPGALITICEEIKKIKERDGN